MGQHNEEILREAGLSAPLSELEQCEIVCQFNRTAEGGPGLGQHRLRQDLAWHVGQNEPPDAGRLRRPTGVTGRRVPQAMDFRTLGVEASRLVDQQVRVLGVLESPEPTSRQAWCRPSFAAPPVPISRTHTRGVIPSPSGDVQRGQDEARRPARHQRDPDPGVAHRAGGARLAGEPGTRAPKSLHASFTLHPTRAKGSLPPPPDRQWPSCQWPLMLDASPWKTAGLASPSATRNPANPRSSRDSEWSTRM